MICDTEGENLMVKDEALSDITRKSIAGLLKFTKAMTAFGNTIPTSYLRLVPHQEAPTNICWGETNRSALVRVPLGWILKTNMIKDANYPFEIAEVPYIPGKQTAELRVPDGSADLYHLVAAMIMSAQEGLLAEDSLKRAEDLYVDVNIFKEEHKHIQDRLEKLPQSCWDSADCLEANREFFEADGVFPKGTIDRFIKQLKGYNDRDLSERLYGKHDEIKKLVDNYLQCM